MFFMCPKENLFAKNHSCKFLFEIGGQPEKNIDKLLPKPEPETIMKTAASLFSLLFFLLFNVHGDPNLLAKNKRGLFTIQFSWDSDSYKRDYRVGINYKKPSLQITRAIKDIPEYTVVQKNMSMAHKLKPGTYTINSIELFSKELNGKKISIAFNRTFTIDAGEVVNGGLIFITKNPENNQVMLLPIDNKNDAKSYVRQRHKDFLTQGSVQITSAWDFIDPPKVDKLIKAHQDMIFAREKLKSKSRVKYLYSVLGTVLEIQRDKDGKPTGYKTISTNTYNQIEKAYFYYGKLLCTLKQGRTLYGDPGSGLSEVPLPAGLNSEPKLYLVGEDKFLVYDKDLNIFTSIDSGQSWTLQDEFKRSGGWINYPYTSFGPDNIYIFTTTTGQDSKLLVSSYTDLNFRQMQLPKEIKRIHEVTATKSKLIIGPIPTNVKKKKATIFIKQKDQDEWKLVEAPRHDCKTISAGKKDEDVFNLTCGVAGARYKYQSTDGGESWKEIK